MAKKSAPDIVVGVLTTTTYEGFCPGASHYTGRIKYAGTEATVFYKPTALQAEKLSSSTYEWKKGHDCHRFFSERACIAKAIKDARKLGITWLIHGETSICDPQKILYGSDERVVKELNELYKRAVRLGFWDVRENEAQMELVSAKWTRIARQAMIVSNIGSPNIPRKERYATRD